ncbi:hypothetical protein SDC9_85944 [bioreactor metagenome]|uniref:Uncharacterized protein n=1 Tax=bioreactor metagenome TaxID=1076179 RepID=A0A644ZHM1_9ZZZZ
MAALCCKDIFDDIVDRGCHEHATALVEEEQEDEGKQVAAPQGPAHLAEKGRSLLVVLLQGEAVDHLLGLKNAKADKQGCKACDEGDDQCAERIACPITIGEKEGRDDETTGDAEDSDAGAHRRCGGALFLAAELVRIDALVVHFPEAVQPIIEANGDYHPEKNRKRPAFCIPAGGNREDENESDRGEHKAKDDPGKAPAKALGKGCSLVGDVSDDRVVHGIPDRVDDGGQGCICPAEPHFGLIEHEDDRTERTGEEFGDELAHSVGDHDAFLSHDTPSLPFTYT